MHSNDNKVNIVEEYNVAEMLPIVPLTGKDKLTDVNGIEDGEKVLKKTDKLDDMIKSTNDIIDDDETLKFEEALSVMYDNDLEDDLFEESVFKEQSDIFYNKTKYENGDTNLLCIVGYSGGGKSTMSGGELKAMREVVDMDRIVLGMSNNDEYFKKLGTFAEQFINGPGKKYRVEGNAGKELIQKMDVISYRPKISKDLFKFAEDYAASHKSTKLIIEGVWIYRYIEPSEASKYAVYIKGTSLKKATAGALKRDHALGIDGNNPASRAAHTIGKYLLASGDAISGALTKWQKYYGDRYEAQKEVEHEVAVKKVKNTVKGIAHDIKHGNIKDDIKTTGQTIKSAAKHAKKKAKKIVKESVYEYIVDNDTIIIESYVEESLKDDIINFKTHADISRKIRVLSADIAIMKFKLKFMNKTNADKKKINDLKREILKKETEKRKLSTELSPEAKEALKKLEKEAEKKAEEEFKEVEKEMSDEIEESVLDKIDSGNLDDVLVFDESTDEVIEEKKDEKETKVVPPELKRLDEIRGDIASLKEKYNEAKEKFDSTSEDVYEKKMKGLSYKIEKLENKLKEEEKKLKKAEEKVAKESVEITEAANMEDEIKPIVDKLNSLGYKVKYASPGHKELRKKEDSEPDGIYYGKLYSDARIMFDDKYKFPDPPKYWHWREVDGCSYLDISPLNYKESDGTPDEAFAKWKDEYMKSLKDFVDSLDKSDDKKDEPTVESVMIDAFEKFGIDLSTNVVEEGFSLFKKQTEKDRLNEEITKLRDLKAKGKISPADFTTKVAELQKKYMKMQNDVGNTLATESLEDIMDDILK